MKKRIQSLTAVIIMFALIMGLAACGSKEDENQNSKSESNETALKVWLPNTFSEEADKLIEERCHEFAESRDDVDKVDVEFISGTDGYAKWNAAIESGDVPDLTFLHVTAYNNYANMGVLEDLSDTVEKVEDSYGALMENHKENFTFDGALYALPLYVQINSMTYRTDYLNQAGAKVPKTWEELREVSKKIKD
ncbi:MAG: extracellular solute-binding protein, partial [Lachnospiraceae bacterium]|nr:extracellular solute-binding protein [Lachnospiraceae bacterium]